MGRDCGGDSVKVWPRRVFLAGASFGAVACSLRTPRAAEMKTRVETTAFGDTVHFYTEIIGLKVVESWDEADDRGVILSASGRATGALLEIGETEQRKTAAGVSLQFRTANLDAFVQRTAGRWPYRGPQQRPWGSTYVYLEDPNGIIVIVYAGGT